MFYIPDNREYNRYDTPKIHECCTETRHLEFWNVIAANLHAKQSISDNTKFFHVLTV